jgi:hypothetical protein
MSGNVHSYTYSLEWTPQPPPPHPPAKIDDISFHHMRNPDPGRQKTLTEKERDEESCCFERLEVFF